jgi:hypothetical protein
MSLLFRRKHAAHHTVYNYALLPEPVGLRMVGSLSILAMAKIADFLHWHMVCWNVGTVLNKAREECATQSDKENGVKHRTNMSIVTEMTAYTFVDVRVFPTYDTITDIIFLLGWRQFWGLSVNFVHILLLSKYYTKILRSQFGENV